MRIGLVLARTRVRVTKQLDEDDIWGLTSATIDTTELKAGSEEPRGLLIEVEEGSAAGSGIGAGGAAASDDRMSDGSLSDDEDGPLTKDAAVARLFELLSSQGVEITRQRSAGWAEELEGGETQRAAAMALYAI